MYIYQQIDESAFNSVASLYFFPLLQRQIQYSELTEVEPIAEGGFGVIHRAKHRVWGTVVYKELKSSIIADGSRFVSHTLFSVKKSSFLTNLVCNELPYDCSKIRHTLVVFGNCKWMSK